jgi:nitrogen regulatory protein PII
MKMIVAYVQPFMAKDVVHALHQIPGVTGASFTDARGFGGERRSDIPVPEVIYGTAEKTRVEVVVSSCLENQASCRTAMWWVASHGVAVRTIWLRMVRSLCMQATRATFFGLPLATSRW